MGNQINIAFEMQGVTISLDKILPSRQIKPKERTTVKYKVIAASIQEVGIIEPPIVHLHEKKTGTYLLLDGHLRLDVLRERGETVVFCLVATEDENYTYNIQRNKVSTIQEINMIMTVLNYGVAEERMAKTLWVDPEKIRSHRNLLHGICEDAVELLKDKEISPQALRCFKKVQPERQIEMAEMMVRYKTYTLTYAQMLLTTTPKEKLLDPDKDKKVAGIKPEDIARMEREMGQLEKDFRIYRDAYQENMFALVLSRGYLTKLVNNAAVVRYLAKHHPEMLAEFQRLVTMATLET